MIPVLYAPSNSPGVEPGSANRGDQGRHEEDRVRWYFLVSHANHVAGMATLRNVEGRTTRKRGPHATKVAA